MEDYGVEGHAGLCKHQSKVNKGTLDTELLWTLVLNPLIKRRTYLLEKASKNKAKGAGTRFKDLKEVLPAKIKTNLLKA